MTSQYVLNYFPAAGRAESIRLLFHVAGVEFTDVHHGDWASIKGDGINKF